MIADIEVKDRSPDIAALDEAWLHGCTGRSASALTIAASVLASCATRGDQAVLARSAQDCAWYCFQLGKAETGLTYGEQAVALWRQLERPASEAQSLSICAWLHMELGNLERAIEFAAEAMYLADQSGDLRSRSLAMNVVGVIFWMSRQPPLAIEYCGRAVALARDAHDLVFECWWLINLGGAHAEAAYLALEAGDSGLFRSAIGPALDVTRQAYRLSQDLGDGWAERLCLGNLAEYSNAMEDFVAAEDFLMRFRAISPDDNARGEGHYLDILGRTLISLKRYEEALVPLQDAHVLATENGNVETLMNACLYLSKAHEGLGVFKPALEFYKRYHSLHQQFTAERTQQNARLVDIRYETKKLKTLLDTEYERSAEIARSFEALRQQTHLLAEAANTDPLTGLGNRRRLEARLIDVKASCKRYALAILDVDHFKRINDTFTHIVGDQVLKTLGGLIASSARETDLTVRFGGEEFVVLMSDVTTAQAQKACERIRGKVAGHDWSCVVAGLSVTVSIGMAMSTEAPTAEGVLQLADRNLYQAKQTGRNRVVRRDLRATGKSCIH